jgi:hypothetical protein
MPIKFEPVVLSVFTLVLSRLDFEQAKQCGGVKPVKGVPTSLSIIGSPTAIYIKLNIIKPAQLLYHDKNTQS